MIAEQTSYGTGRSRVFLAAWVLYAGYYFCRKDFGSPATGQAPVTTLAAALACFGAAYAIGQLVGGAMADRVGARRTALAGAGISIASTVLLACNTRPGVVLALQLVNGFGQGFGWPAILKLLGAWFRAEERRRVLGWWSTSYILSGLVASSLAAYLIEHAGVAGALGRLRPEPAFLVPSLLLLAAAVFFARATARLPAVPPVVGDEQGQPTPREVWRYLLRSREMQRIAGMYVFLKMTRYTLLFWLPMYLVSSFGYTGFGAAHTASYFELLGFLGPIAVGYAPRRWFARNSMAFGATLLFALAFACLVHPVLAGSGSLGMVVSTSLMGLLIHGADLLMSGMAVLDTFPEAMHGRAVGMVNAAGSVGQVLSPLLITLFVSRVGWSELFDLFVFLALVSGTICAVGAHASVPGELRANRSVLGPSGAAV